MLYIPNLLLISGNGRDSGKTTFACGLIRVFSKEMEITGMKISPHFHGYKDQDELIYSDDYTIMTREKDTLSSKDSSRMLRSGAKEVIYVQARKNGLQNAVVKLSSVWESGEPVICESGGLIDYVRPGLFLMLYRNGVLSQKSAKHNHLVDKWITSDWNSLDISSRSISFTDSRWYLTLNKDR